MWANGCCSMMEVFYCAYNLSAVIIVLERVLPTSFVLCYPLSLTVCISHHYFSLLVSLPPYFHQTASRRAAC